MPDVGASEREDLYRTWTQRVFHEAVRRSVLGNIQKRKAESGPEQGWLEKLVSGEGPIGKTIDLLNRGQEGLVEAATGMPVKEMRGTAEKKYGHRYPGSRPDLAHHTYASELMARRLNPERALILGLLQEVPTAIHSVRTGGPVFGPNAFSGEDLAADIYGIGRALGVK